MLYQSLNYPTCITGIISPNEVFSDIMVLTSLHPHHRPPVNTDNVNALTQMITFKIHTSTGIHVYIDTPEILFDCNFILPEH